MRGGSWWAGGWKRPAEVAESCLRGAADTLLSLPGAAGSVGLKCAAKDLLAAVDALPGPSTAAVPAERWFDESEGESAGAVGRVREAAEVLREQSALPGASPEWMRQLLPHVLLRKCGPSARARDYGPAARAGGDRPRRRRRRAVPPGPRGLRRAGGLLRRDIEPPDRQLWTKFVDLDERVLDATVSCARSWTWASCWPARSSTSPRLAFSWPSGWAWPRIAAADVGLHDWVLAAHLAAHPPPAGAEDEGAGRSGTWRSRPPCG